MAQHGPTWPNMAENQEKLLAHLRNSAQTIKLMICPQWSEAFYAAIPEAVNKPTWIALVHIPTACIRLQHRLQIIV